MDKYDDFIRKKVNEEQTDIPDFVKAKIDDTLASLPEQNILTKQSDRYAWKNFTSVAACLLLLFVVILPNCSVVYAQALEDVPIIGDIIKVVTIRNYFYSDDNHEMDIHVPKILIKDSDTADPINADIDKWTKVLTDTFYEDLKTYGYEGHGSVQVDYEVITNTPTWFTLKLFVLETAASSNTYYKYYHIDKTSGKVVHLGDLSDETDFLSVLEDEIKRQMKESVPLNPNQIYWVNDTEIGENFVTLNETHNFYWDENGNLVIVFDKYEVAPGAMGTPEFTISKEFIQDMLLPQYR